MCMFKGVSVCTGVCVQWICVAVCVGWVLTVVFFVYFLGVRRGHPHSHSLLVSDSSHGWLLHSMFALAMLCCVVEREWRAKQEVAVCELQSQTKSCKEKNIKNILRYLLDSGFMLWRKTGVCIKQGWTISVLEGHCPAKFCSSPNQTHLKLPSPGITQSEVHG